MYPFSAPTPNPFAVAVDASVLDCRASHAAATPSAVSQSCVPPIVIPASSAAYVHVPLALEMENRTILQLSPAWWETTYRREEEDDSSPSSSSFVAFNATTRPPLADVVFFFAYDAPLPAIHFPNISTSSTMKSLASSHANDAPDAVTVVFGSAPNRAP